MATPTISIEQVEDAWRYNLDTYAERVSDGDWLPYRWHVYLAEKIAEAVLAGRGRIIVTAPPQHGKSTLVAEWLPAWYLDLFPTKKVILASYASPLAASKSEVVRDRFDGSNPHTWARLNPNHATKAEWLLQQGGGMKAVGVGSGITGFGGDLIIIDDPIKDWFEAQSAAALQKVIDWFNGTLYHRKTSSDTTFILIRAGREKPILNDAPVISGQGTGRLFALIDGSRLGRPHVFTAGGINARSCSPLGLFLFLGGARQHGLGSKDLCTDSSRCMGPNRHHHGRHCRRHR